MIKQMTLFALALAVVSGGKSLRADETYVYPALNEYRAQAEKLISLTQAAGNPEDLAAIRAKTKDLIQTVGIPILELYGEKNSACAVQCEAFKTALGTMEDLPLNQVEDQFHDGKGLPTAPRHCYFGRSVIVHPVMNIIRVNGAWNDDVRDQVIDDFQEAIEHLARIQKNLDNPPN